MMYIPHSMLHQWQRWLPDRGEAMTFWPTSMLRTYKAYGVR
ncbi:MAG: hypothetical protein ACLVD7_12470 [[Clostridium] leptum]